MFKLSDLPQGIPTVMSNVDDDGGSISDDPTVFVHLFSAHGWQWLITEFDGDDLAFGVVQGFETELGYVALSELLNSRHVFIDKSFRPMPLSEAKAKYFT